ncbi:hypothetical protein GCM10007898_27000 [Dyella flagellata]|uniref:Uncharacterized protein n=2 Tax=Dyella flagellata TaxID=1867833 RepID=A0ABQ5XEV8_9GAMM|nr:hypothetical protein GCM10007898_27000 [Dyella flagellata]
MTRADRAWSDYRALKQRRNTMDVNDSVISPIGLNHARELSMKDLNQVGGGTQTFHAKGTYTAGKPDADVEYDIQW